MKYTRSRLLKIVISISFFSCCSSNKTGHAPRLTLVLIVDQFAYEYIPKLARYFSHGLHTLFDQGTVYDQAYYPHAFPVTATGHAGLSTGADPKCHGIIDNMWYEAQDSLINSDDDIPEKAAVFAKKGLYDYGKSARNILVDALSDQYILHTKENRALALAHKSRAATALANKLGKAIWFDPEAGQFTSSRAYFQEIPEWLTAINGKLSIDTLRTLRWDLMYPREHPAYQGQYATNYTYTHYPKGLIGRSLQVGCPPLKDKPSCCKDPYALWLKTPQANQALFDVAIACIKTYLPQTAGGLLVWISLNSLDYLGHDMGPESLETTDMLLQLDRQLGDFLHTVERFASPEETLVVLTADHGIDPIPELLNERGLPAGRIMLKKLVAESNQKIERTFGITDLIAHANGQQLYLNETKLNTLKPHEQKKVKKELIAHLKQQEGIAHAWLQEELLEHTFLPHEHAYLFKNQFFPGRSGNIIIEPRPYFQLTTLDKGTGHTTPYSSNTHVPLVLYRKEHLPAQTVLERVCTLQLTNTLAYFLGVSQPTASTYPLLPNITQQHVGPHKAIITE